MTYKVEFLRLAEYYSNLAVSHDNQTVRKSLHLAVAEAFATLENLGEPVQSLSVQAPNVGTDADTVEKILGTFTLPGGTLASEVEAVKITAFGTWATGTDSRRIRLYFGATVVLDANQIHYAVSSWRVSALVLRDGAASQVALGEGIIGADPTIDEVRDLLSTTPAETMSGDIVIKVTGQNTVATLNTIVLGGMLVQLIP